MNTVNCGCGCGSKGCSCNFQPCAVVCEPCVRQFGDYAYIYNTTEQTVASGDSFAFSANGQLSGTITHTAGTAETVIGRAGMYLVNFTATTEAGENYYTLFKNSQPVLGATYETESGTTFGQTIISAQAGDVITFVNSGEAETKLIAETASGQPVVNASITLVRLF